MAFSGQMGTHPPQPLHPASLIVAISRPWAAPASAASSCGRLGPAFGGGSGIDTCSIAPYGQASRHLPHQVHLSGSTVATSGSSSATPFLRTEALWVTAASPEATLSAELLGPWQAPAMSTPSTTVSTGRGVGGV